MNKIIELLNKKLTSIDMYTFKIVIIWLVYINLVLLSVRLMFIEAIAAFGQSLFVGLILIGFTYYFTKYIFESEKLRRWEHIKEKVTAEINEEFLGILNDIAMICEFSEVMVFDHDASPEEISDRYDKMILAKLKKYSSHEPVKIGEVWKDVLLDGGFGTLFEARESFLNQFQIKYLDYLEADVIIKLIDVQKAFHRVDQYILIRNKQIKNNWLRLDSDEQILNRVQEQFKVILNGIQFMVNRGILKYK